MRHPLKHLLNVMAAVGAMLAMNPALAARLDSATFGIFDAHNQSVALLADGRPETGHLLRSGTATDRFTIDLGGVHTAHRIYFTSTPGALNPASTDPNVATPATVRVLIKTGQGTLLASREIGGVTGREIRVEANFRFQPVAGRHLVVELERGALANAWNVGEVEVYGWPGDALATKQDAVVLNAGAAAPLKLAADELSYYLGELAGRPVPTVTPDQAAQYPGTLFRIADLKPLAPTYAQMTNNMALGLFPAAPVNVERSGREIIFRAWPYRCVLWSVWEFLDRQGVKWLYPDAHGDHVPAGQGINLNVAPFQFTPGSDYIYANFGVEFLQGDPDAFLHYWRNRWTHTWGNHQTKALGESEVPAAPRASYTPPAEYAEGFEGYPHNFGTVIPERLLNANPDWCGILTNQMWATWPGAHVLNQRLPTRLNWSAPDMSNPELRQFITDKAISWWPGLPPWLHKTYWLLPDDSALFSEDPRSVSLRGALTYDPVPYALPYPFSVSDEYYGFIRDIAQRIGAALPEAKVGAMAYSNTHRPPTDRTPLPTNVTVDVCLYGERNLPMSSPKNAEMRQRLLDWSELATHRRFYAYDLIHREAGPLRMPVPLVSATEDRARLLRELNMTGGTQADLYTLPYNPWNYYAYPRFFWNPALTSDRVLDEFFHGYFREAGAAMRTYYTTLERHLVTHNVTLQGRGYDYGLRVGAFSPDTLRAMDEYLREAEARASYWVTKKRLAPIREGLDWILAQRGLTYEDLYDPNAFAAVGPGLTHVIDLRAAGIQTAGQVFGDSWFLYSWAQVGDYVNFRAAGRYLVTVPAGIGYPAGDVGNRQMLLHIGGLQYGPFTIDHEAIQSYVLLVDLPAGVVEVAVEDLNNRGAFKARSITLRGLAPGETPDMTPAPGVRVFDYTGVASPGNAGTLARTMVNNNSSTVTVSVAATPATNVNTYVVEESVPAGLTVLEVNENGTWSDARRKVTWGPFADSQCRTLTYELTGNEGSYTLQGQGVFDGSGVSVKGEQQAVIQLPERPPEPSTVTRAVENNGSCAVTIRVTANPAASVLAYRLEESVPAGLQVTQMSSGGRWDAASRKVIWGPFQDRERRVVWYTVAGAEGAYPLHGTGVFDGVATGVTGASDMAIVCPRVQEAFTGGPWPVPGRIECENFDEGGPALAYHDTTPGNSGKTYRTKEDVDIFYQRGAGNNHHVRGTQAGEWMEYMIRVPTSGLYDVDTRISALSSGGVFEVWIGDVNTGATTVKSTRAWGTFATHRKSHVALTAGSHIMRLNMLRSPASGDIAAFDSISIVNLQRPLRPQVGAWPVSTRIEFENFDEGGQSVSYSDSDTTNAGRVYRTGERVDIYRIGTSQTEFAVGAVRVGEWLEYTVDVPAAGDYLLNVRLSANDTGGAFSVSFNGADKTGLLAVPNTRSTATFRNLRATVRLAAGRQVVRFDMRKSGRSGLLGHFDHFLLAPVPTNTAPVNPPVAGEPATTVRPVDVVVSDGGWTNTQGWLAFDGDTNTVWSGQQGAGGWWLAATYNPSITLTNLAIEYAENSLTNAMVLYSTNATQWSETTPSLTNASLSLAYLWLIYPDDGSGRVPAIRDIRVNASP